MSYAIIGFGKIGHALARAFARKGIEVSVATTRDPESFASDAAPLVAAVLDQNPAVHGGRRVVFLASDDDGAAAEIGALAENLGFSPINLGGLSEGGLLVQARGSSWGRLIFKDLVRFD